MSPVIEIHDLRKTFRGLRSSARVALNGFDMLVEAGQVHGFLGPNGSGKTTTLRVLLGLVNADGGWMTILGHPAPQALPLVADRVGAIVESPQFFGNFTGRHTLRLLATVGGLPPARVEEALERVGLRDRGGERVRAYSLGMKQRLAVASALLKRPELLILDEPANGLDPAGIREVRELVRRLAAEGVTVLISSHILAEIQQICDSVTIISRGRRVTAGPVGEVLAQHDKGEFRVRVAEHRRAASLIRQAWAPAGPDGNPGAQVAGGNPGGGVQVSVRDDHLVVSNVADPAWISRTLGGHDLWVTELTPVTPDLESVFLELTGTMPVASIPRQVGDSMLPPWPEHGREPGAPVVSVWSPAGTPGAAGAAGALSQEDETVWARPRDGETLQ